MRRPNTNWTRRGWLAHSLRTWLCAHGLHYPIRFVYDIVPTYLGEDPTPPEDGWGCAYCHHVRDPYTWPLRAATIWRIKQWWYERPGGAFEREMEGR